MRKYLIIMAAVLLVAVGSVLAVVFTAGASSPSKGVTAKSTATLDQVQTVLQPIVQKNKDVTGGSAEYSLTITPTKSPSASSSGPMAALLSSGFTLSGTVKADGTAKAFDVTFAAALGTGTPLMKAEVYWKGTEGWVNYAGTWYTMPPKVLKEVKQAEARHTKADQARHAAMERKAMKLMTRLGVDPQAWLKDLTIGTDASLTQISTGFDVQQIAADAVKIGQSKQFRAMAEKEMARLEAKVGARGMHAKQRALEQASKKQAWRNKDLSQVPSQAAQVVQDPRATLWVDGSAFKKFELTLTVVPPAQANAPISSAGVEFTVDNIELGPTMVAPSTPVTDPQPWSKLQSQFKGMQRMFGGLAHANSKGSWK
jgi:hypothetical protein